jgi:uncharacterized Zn finger protein
MARLDWDDYDDDFDDDDDYDEDYDYDDYYRSYYPPPSRPLPAKGGIKARSRRGTFAASWWSQRWITVLESFGLGTRLTRGRSYARSGQVVGLEIKPGVVNASVQGSRPNPYQVRIAIKEIDRSQRGRLGKALAADMSVAAKLIAGQLPPEVEQCFKAAGAPLFPERFRDLKTWCSCPDSSNPCKHIAAVYYLLAEELDRDPFQLIALRGISREQFTAMLGAESSRAAAANDEKAIVTDQPLNCDPRRFWRAAKIPEHSYAGAAAGQEAAPVARRLGPFPLWRGESDFLEEIGRLSRDAAARAIELLASSSE